MKFLKLIILFFLFFSYGYMANQLYFQEEKSDVIDTLPVNDGREISLSFEKEPIISMPYETFKHIIKTRQFKDIEQKLGVLFYRQDIVVEDFKPMRFFRNDNTEKSFSGMGSCNFSNCVTR